MKCPICKNTVGFALGTCIDCGWNYLDNSFHHIEINTDELRRLVDPDTYKRLIEEHRCRRYRKEIKHEQQTDGK